MTAYGPDHPFYDEHDTGHPLYDEYGTATFEAKDAFWAEWSRTHNASAGHDYACAFQATAEVADELGDTR